MLDNENHRLNSCPIFRHLNLCDEVEKVKFDDIYSDDLDVVKQITEKIRKVWNVSNGNGRALT